MLLVNHRHFALVVEQVLDTEEIVVRPLSKHLMGVSVYSGATILGDGRVALIVDVLALARSCGVSSTSNASNSSECVGNPKDFIIVGNGGRQFAIHVEQVTRLEEFRRSQMEVAGGQYAVQYRGGILPLFFLGRLLPKRSEHEWLANAESSEGEKISVIVVHENNLPCGVVVERILDIEEYDDSSGDTVEPGASHKQIIIQGRITEILNLRKTIDDGLAIELTRKQVEVGLTQ